MFTFDFVNIDYILFLRGYVLVGLAERSLLSRRFVPLTQSVTSIPSMTNGNPEMLTKCRQTCWPLTVQTRAPVSD